MPARFCLQCGGQLVTGPVAGRERQHCPACGFILYRNPLPVSLALVEHAGRLLLIRRANPPLAGYWAPPAGYVEIDESIEAAAIRETREEAGVEVALSGLAGVYSHGGVGVFIVAYRGRVVGGQPRAGEDATDAAYFAPGEVPQQPPPAGDAPALDRWFYTALAEMLAPWIRPAQP